MPCGALGQVEDRFLRPCDCLRGASPSPGAQGQRPYCRLTLHAALPQAEVRRRKVSKPKHSKLLFFLNSF